MCSRRWVWEQYDHLIGGNTVQRPGGDAAVVRVDGTERGLAFSLDVTPRYCAADPFEGGKQAVAECWRNLTAVGAEPLARHRQSQFRQSRAAGDHGRAGRRDQRHRRGLPRARLPGRLGQCLALQRDQRRGDPADAGDRRRRPPAPTRPVLATLAFKAEGEAIFLVGAPRPGTHLGQSIYLREILGREDGPPPPVDLATEKRVGDFVRGLIRDGLRHRRATTSPTAACVALAEMAMARASAQRSTIPPECARLGFLFGEDQGRYVVTAPAAGGTGALGSAPPRSGIPLFRLGTVGGERFELSRRGDHICCKAPAGPRSLVPGLHGRRGDASLGGRQWR